MRGAIFTCTYTLKLWWVISILETWGTQESLRLILVVV
jgi:hypothetical protein